jgi:imidazolonepropionase-like amidohydrolase
MPGLWDTHVHLDGDGAVLRVLLQSGVTGVRDMGGDIAPLLEARRLIATGQWEGPRMIVSGPMLRGPQSESDHSSRGTRVIRTPEDGRTAVRELAMLGADFVKVQNFLSRDAFLAIAEAAREHKLPLAGHVPPTVSPVEASDAGETNISHFGEWLPKACAPLFRTDEAAKDAMPEGMCDKAAVDAILQRLVRNGTWLEPTIAQFRYLAPGAYRAILAGFQRLVPDMRRAGVRILAGTDWNGELSARGGRPGETLHEELRELVAAGFPPAEALRAATSNPAEFFGFRRQLGSIEPGMIADLVLLTADPLADIRNTQHVAGVMRNGQFIR